MKILLTSIVLCTCVLGNLSAENFKNPTDNNQNALTYSFSGGRFGDNLIAYLHAKWISYKYHMPLIYTPFCYSDQLKMHDYETFPVAEWGPRFKNHKAMQNEIEATNSPNNTLFVLTYFPESFLEVEMYGLQWLPYFIVDWKDPVFSAEIKRMVSPRFPIQTVEVPKGKLSVAIHARKGGGVDPEHYKVGFPLKLPPDTFYVEAIQQISRMYPKEKIYLYVFTDDLDPFSVAKKFKKMCKNVPNLYFDYRKTSNGPTMNVLEDFFSMQKFDCLIRPVSSFSIAVEKLHDFKVIISPKHCRIQGNVVTIDQLDVFVDKGN